MDYPIQSIASIEAEGRQAGQRPGKPARNPYPIDSPHGKAWEAGFAQGRQTVLDAAVKAFAAQRATSGVGARR